MIMAMNAAGNDQAAMFVEGDEEGICEREIR